MKKIFFILFFIAFIFCNSSVYAMKYEEAISSPKPTAILVYADWADNVQSYLQSFNMMSTKYSSRFNFVPINIATKEAKTFSNYNVIQANLPYVILIKNNGKFNRRLKSDCALNESCFLERLELFVN